MGLNPARTHSFHAYRFCTVHGNELYEPMWPLEALICLWGGFPLLSTGAECSALPPEAVLGRTGRCRGAYGVPANLFSYGSFPLDCPRGITGCRWRRECVLRCQIAGFDELSKRVRYLNFLGAWSWRLSVAAGGGTVREPWCDCYYVCVSLLCNACILICKFEV